MQSMAICPNCRTLLVSLDDDQMVLRCERCSGQFVRGETPPEPQNATFARPVAVDAILYPCPNCLTPMDSTGVAPLIKQTCPACGGTWTDAAAVDQEVADLQTESPLPEEVAIENLGFVKSLLYGVSMPERVLRSAVGMTAGTLREAAQLMIPQAFQNSKSYEVAIHNSLTFLTETVGGFESQTPGDDNAGEHLAKKAIGNFVDLAGIATLHVSPMWILAAVSDIAYGSSTYLKELAVELEKQGIINESSTIHNVDDILDAIQNTSGNMASKFDKPPLSIAELREFVAETRESANRADLRKLLPESEVRKYWETLSATATKENVTLFEAATAVAMQTVDQASMMSMSAVTGVKVVGSLLQRNILQHYQDALTTLRKEGFLSVVQSTYQPYVGQVWNNFSAKKKSWTETLLDPQRFINFFQSSDDQK